MADDVAAADIAITTTAKVTVSTFIMTAIITVFAVVGVAAVAAHL